MENDDLPVGSVLTRREILSLLGLSGAALLAACTPELSQTAQPEAVPTTTILSENAAPTTTGTAAEAAALPTCIAQPELTEGPYYVDADFDRSDIRSDPASGVVRAGTPLALSILVSQITESACTPLAGARVEIWHCDAEGVYSGVADPGFDTTGQKFLRGFQTTGADGQVQFTTIYPGWYSGRCIHIHFKVHHDGAEASRVFTSQLFFDDTLSDEALSQPPYNGRGTRNTRNNQDRIFDDRLVLDAARDGSSYRAAFHVGVVFN